MKISAEEKLMYTVMKAIYESGIPISFKGDRVSSLSPFLYALSFQIQQI